MKGTTMKTYLLITTGIAAAACAAILAPGTVAEAAAESASQTIAVLEAQGFDVRVNRLGSAPIDECVVTDIRNPRRQTGFVLRDEDGDNPFATGNNRRQTITVSVDCSR
ncbi:hypothetical protein [Mycobacterium sp. NPDC050041]|uniref:hypothetical protein n=1 Tax=Mycobacterium sp. NPDC050041 TaxID=3364293 RepID=UPI003C2FEA14